MEKKTNKHKLWQSMINTNLTPDEFIKLSVLSKIREQSLRELVSSILRQELNAFADIISIKTDVYMLLPSLEANVSQKRGRGRPRLKDMRSFAKINKEEALPVSMAQIIEENS